MDELPRHGRLTWRLFPGAGWLLSLAIALQAYRLLTVVADNGETPFLSANDRSRWCTIASLIEDRSFVIDRLLDKRDRSGKKRTWYSIDMVRKPEIDGSEHYYSSKPPLLSVIHAAICSPLTVILNHRLTDAPLLVGRTLLVIVQLLPLACMWYFFARWIEQRVAHPFGRWAMLITLLFGTFLATFANTLNNHLPAAICMVTSIWLLERFFARSPRAPATLAPTGRGAAGASIVPPSGSRFPAADLGLCWLIGLMAGLTAAFELPALAWAAAVLGLLLMTGGWLAATMAGAGMLPIAFAFAVTNWIAYGDLQPPYAHRELLGQHLTTCRDSSPPPIASSDFASWLSEIRKADEATWLTLQQHFGQAILEQGIAITQPYELRAARRAKTLEFSAGRPRDATANSAHERNASSSASSSGTSATAPERIRFAVVPVADGWSIHRWNDWYDYPKSYWLPENKRGVDLGEPSSARYAFHVLVGHHGIFSLTPVWIFSLFGAALRLLRRPVPAAWREQPSGWWLAAAISLTSLVCIGFYLARPLIDRNYGGVCSGFRWQFWLIPAWLWLAAPAVEAMGRRPFTRWLLAILVAISIFSASYAWSNPWQSPWPYAWFYTARQ